MTRNASYTRVPIPNSDKDIQTDPELNHPVFLLLPLTVLSVSLDIVLEDRSTMSFYSLSQELKNKIYKHALCPAEGVIIKPDSYSNDLKFKCI